MSRALAAFAIAAALAAPAAAAPARPTLNEVEAQLMCDTCNVGLAIAESPRADQERAEIRKLIAQGKTKQQILDIFVSEYGPNVLADPKGGGSATASWLVPTAVLVAALAGILFMLPRWRRRNRRPPDDSSPPSQAEISPDDADRLARDLALYD